ncbi:MAG: hypothetical protein WBB36_11700 [Chitinophagales bacterium]
MAIELKDVLEFAGVDPAKADTLDNFKAEFNSAFIKRDASQIKADKELYGAIVGNTNGSVRTAIKRVAKESGVDITDEELNGKSAHEMVDIAFPKIVTPLSAKLRLAEENAAKSTDKKVQDLQADYEKKLADLNPKLSGFDSLRKEYDDFKASVETEKKNTVINSHKDAAWKDFKWANGISQFAKEGFMASIDKKIKLSLDDSGNPFAANDKGERFENPKTAGTYKSYAELIAEEGLAANAKGEKIFAVAGNQGTGTQQRGTFTAKEENNNGGAWQPATPGARKRIINTSTRPAA